MSIELTVPQYFYTVPYIDSSIYINKNNNAFTLCVIGVLCYVYIHIVNTLIEKNIWNSNWFQLHSAINFLVALLTFNDVVDCLVNPNMSNNAPSSMFQHTVAGMLGLMLHIYHCIMFNLRSDDWIHHFTSVFIVSPICIIYPSKGLSMFYFFCTGLPGAIDYTALVFRKNEMITKYTQKYITAHTNGYIRIPGGIICSYLLFKDSLIIENYYTRFLSFIIYMNVTFYGKQAITSFGYITRLE